LVEDFRDGANGPRIWSFDDSVEEEITMMVAGKRSLGIQVDGAPIPALRNDAGEARADAGIAGAVRKKDAKFSRNARAGLVLQAPGYDHVLEECPGCRQARRSHRRKRCLSLAFEDGFPPLAEAVVDDHVRRDQACPALIVQRSRRLKFNLHFTFLRDRCIGAVERAIGRRRSRPGDESRCDDKAGRKVSSEASKTSSAFGHAPVPRKIRLKALA